MTHLFALARTEALKGYLVQSVLEVCWNKTYQREGEQLQSEQRFESSLYTQLWWGEQHEHFSETRTNTDTLSDLKRSLGSQTMEGTRGAGHDILTRLQQSVVTKNTATLPVQGYSLEQSKGRMSAKGHLWATANAPYTHLKTGQTFRNWCQHCPYQTKNHISKW